MLSDRNDLDILTPVDVPAVSAGVNDLIDALNKKYDTLRYKLFTEMLSLHYGMFTVSLNAAEADLVITSKTCHKINTISLIICKHKFHAIYTFSTKYKPVSVTSK